MKATLTGTAEEERAGGVADRRGRKHLPGARGRRDRSTGQPFAGDKDLVLDEAIAERDAALDARSSARVGSSGPTASRSTRRRRRRDRVHERRPRRRRTRATRRTTRSSSSSTPPATGSGCASSACRRLPTAATRSPPTRRRTIYVTGYTRGDLAGDEPGRQGRLPRQARPGRRRSSGCGSSASAGEDKGWGVAATGDGVRVGGMTSGTLGTPVGALDGWVARYDAAGSRGLAAAVRHDRQRGGLGADGRRGRERVRRRRTRPATSTARWRATRTSSSPGSTRPERMTWSDQLGTDLNDKGAAIQLDGAGNLYVAGFSDGSARRRTSASSTPCSSSTHPTRPASGRGSSARSRTTAPMRSPRPTSTSHARRARSTCRR